MPLVIGGAPFEFQKPALACSSEATAMGVTAGMTLRQVQTRCPDAVVLPPDAERDAAAFAPILDALDQFSPTVAAAEPGLAFCDVANLEAFFGPDLALAEAIRSAVSEIYGDDVRVGIAGNRFCAQLAAGWGIPTEGDGIASVVGGERDFLEPLPVRLLPRLAPDIRERLRFLGVHTMGDFRKLSRHAVVTRFGKEAGTAHDLARGVDHMPLLPRDQSPLLHLSDRLALEEPELRLDRLVFVFRRLLTRLEARLRRDVLLCRALEVLLEMEQGEPVPLSIHLSVPTASAKQLTDLVRWQLERRWLGGGRRSRARQTGITAVSIRVADAVPCQALQLSLFGASRAQSERVALAIDRLRVLLGPNAVQRAVVPPETARQSRLPEGAFLLEPYRLPDQRTEAIRPALPSVPIPALRFLDPPRAVQAVVQDGRLRSLHIHQRREPIIACAGPWRLAEGWWAQPVERDYYHVLTKQRTAYLIYRDHDIDRWYLHGMFD